MGKMENKNKPKASAKGEISQTENKKLEQIAERILKEYEYAFEVLGNGEV